jgi:hypothetical protein
MHKLFRNKVGACAVGLALATSSFYAHAVLERAGPVSIDPTVGGFPAWYQDTTGLALEFCAPQKASEDGVCCFPPSLRPKRSRRTFSSNTSTLPRMQ